MNEYKEAFFNPSEEGKIEGGGDISDSTDPVLEREQLLKGELSREILLKKNNELLKREEELRAALLNSDI